MAFIDKRTSNEKMYLRWNDDILLSFIRENTPGFLKYLGIHGTLKIVPNSEKILAMHLCPLSSFGY